MTADSPPAAATAPRTRLGRLRAHLSTLPNQLTALRLAAVPVLWGLALMDRPVWVGVGAGLAAATDVLDGYLSRKWGQTSRFGSFLDSAADHLLTISMVAWIFILRPGFVREQGTGLLAWGGFALGVLAVSLVKFRRPVDLHLYSSKAAVVTAWLFAVPLLVTGRYAPAHWYATLAVATFAAAESLAVVLTRRTVDEKIGSLLLPRHRRRGR
ncbi:MAG TPA: CDP-alcohol phosphatidyltransferase family protein [Longimicrobium sp.]|nr:CDP-alcohol phosphatidyltransferase family protein [Longimicrobium sp.]